MGLQGFGADKRGQPSFPYTPHPGGVGRVRQVHPVTHHWVLGSLGGGLNKSSGVNLERVG